MRKELSARKVSGTQKVGVLRLFTFLGNGVVVCAETRLLCDEDAGAAD
jgi:hypothetical protein